LANLVIMTAEELKALHSLNRQVARRAARQQPLVGLILRIFLREGGPIPVEDIVAASPDGHAEALVTLDDEDIIRVRAGQIDIAYPFSAGATPSVCDWHAGGNATPVARPTPSASRQWSANSSRSSRPATTAAIH